VDINREQQINVAQISIKIDREKAARYGLKVGDLAQAIETLLNGKHITSILEGRRSFDLFVRLNATDRDTLKEIQDMLIEAPALVSGEQNKIPLRALFN
jgi:Cu/Ag efflux pump CusA